MTKRVLVTGGCGFIGSHLVDGLLERGYQVRVLDLLSKQVHPEGRAPDYLNPAAEYHFEDVGDSEAVSRALEGVDVVVHFAAAVGVGQSMYEPEHYVRANTMATAVLLQQIVDSKSRPSRMLVASSMSIYGEGRAECPQCGVQPSTRSQEKLEQASWEPTCPDCGVELEPRPTPESHDLKPTSVYAMTKLDQEVLCLAIGRAYGVATVALRFFNVYGPRQSLSNPYTGVAAIFSSRLKNGRPPVVYEDGNQLRDFVNVQDIVAACTLAIEDERADFGVFNVGTGSPITIGDLAKLLISIHGLEGTIAPELPGKFRVGDIRHCFADISAISALGYQPAVSLERGLSELKAWSETRDAIDQFDEAQERLRKFGLA